LELTVIVFDRAVIVKLNQVTGGLRITFTGFPLPLCSRS
jgi:hypothetical protein